MGSQRFTMDDIRKRGLQIVGEPTVKKKPTEQDKELARAKRLKKHWPKEKLALYNSLPKRLEINGLVSLLHYAMPNDKSKKEFKPNPERRWAFDLCYPEHKIAIEYEGLFAIKSGHTTPKGFTNDCYKYNWCVINGWRVLRYTVLNYQQAFLDIKTLAEKEW